MPLQPITSAATNRIGIIPTGMVVGSRVLCCFLDEEKQNPIILGTYARSGSSKSSDDNDHGLDKVDFSDSDINGVTG